MNQIEIFFENKEALRVNPKDLEQFRRESIVKSVIKGSMLLYPGADCEYLPFMLTGNIKVHRTAENGREIILYHINDGESCILSAMGILNNTAFPASAIIEQSGEVLLLPAQLVKKLINDYSGWRNYVFSLYNQRFVVVLELIDEILFRKLDIRLAKLLIIKKNSENKIFNMTHQALAEELGSSREVISRILKTFSSKKLISYQRNEILICDIEKLRKMSTL
jgi:CRP/FNR family transcriptional regulator, anaerobic regulatory protein